MDSREFMGSIPTTPLAQQVLTLHKLLLHLGADGDSLLLGENALFEVARFHTDSTVAHKMIAQLAEDNVTLRSALEGIAALSKDYVQAIGGSDG